MVEGRNVIAVYVFQNKLDKSQEELLKTFGCVCTSPHIKVATTDASLIKKYADQFGHYHFQVRGTSAWYCGGGGVRG
jgi:hypothetical protein